MKTRGRSTFTRLQQNPTQQQYLIFDARTDAKSILPLTRVRTALVKAVMAFMLTMQVGKLVFFEAVPPCFYRHQVLAAHIHAPSGNAVDPFDILGFQITTDMHEIIEISVHSLLPSLYLYPYMKRLSRKLPSNVSPLASAATLIEGNLAQGFGHEGCASAWICAHTNSLAKFHSGLQQSKMQSMAMWLKGHALKSLYQRISKLSDIKNLDPSLVMQVVWVHGISCMENRFEDAEMHARLLSKILGVLLDGPMMVEIFITAMYNDLELAVNSMKRTTLDFELCFGEKLTAFWLQHAVYIPKLVNIDKQSHRCIAQPDLRLIFTRLRQFLRLSDTDDLVEVPNHPSGGLILYAWISSVTQYDSGILLCRYIDLMDFKLQTATLGERYMEAALTLTLLHLLRKYFHETPFCGVDLRDASKPIMSALKTTLGLALKHSTKLEVSVNEEALLWMLFVGSQHEQRLHSEAGSTDDMLQTWFQPKLIAQARSLGVLKWVDAHTLLQSFLYTDFHVPNGETWYESLVAAGD
jgi:hypothetical protein